MSLVTNALPKHLVVEPENKREVGLLAEVPLKHLNRRVIIEPRPRKSLQQGEGYSHQWQITWPPEERWANPLMGWTSSGDPLSSVIVSFPFDLDYQIKMYILVILR